MIRRPGHDRRSAVRSQQYQAGPVTRSRPSTLVIDHAYEARLVAGVRRRRCRSAAFLVHAGRRSAAAAAPAANHSSGRRSGTFANIKQLTFGGENAEAYFSFDGKRLSFQSTKRRTACDQIYTMNIDGSDVQAA